MKKALMLLFVAVAAISLAACNSSDYKVDGTFTAYEADVHDGPMVTMVSVTIKDGEIESFYIDARQGGSTQTAGEDTADDTSDDTYAWSWNEKTKKELGDDYNMVAYGGATAEWYEQAEALEAYFLENGVDDVPTKTVDDEVYFDGIAGVTIKDGSYVALAKEAVQLAKDGKFQSILCEADDLYSATMTVNKDGEFSNLKLDVLQGNPSGATFAWSEDTKQEKGDTYGMKGVGGGYTFTDGAWVSSGENATLEWYEQAALITDYVTANGWNSSLEALAGRGGTIDGSTLVDDLAGATIHTGSYYDVLADLFAAANLD
ncbi:hypothetical protein KHQ89_05050 [Mycoplasmatota bacterium]|nr:hypothetical protein KHQ89_05050 [Mycoplasmatota bacterium]